MTTIPAGFDGRCACCGSPYTFKNAKALGTKDWNVFCSNVCAEASAPYLAGNQRDVRFVCAACGTKWVGPHLTPIWSRTGKRCQGTMTPNV